MEQIEHDICMISEIELNAAAYEYSGKISRERWDECMKRWDALTKPEQEKYNQLVGFNDISDMLYNDVAEGYKEGYKKANEPVEDMGEVSDGYHTFNELYEFRLLYNAALFNQFAEKNLYDVHKSRRHSDGEYPFGKDNWFIVMAELPTGQISNHYEMKYWDLFKIPEKEKSNKWDGHTPKDVAERLRNFLEQ